MPSAYRFLCAARDGNVAEVRSLLSSYELSDSDEWSDGYTLLRDALENGHASVAEVLLDAGARVNNQSGKPVDTPLHYAAEKGLKDIVERLLSMDARVNAVNKSDSTPLHCAAGQKNDEIVQLLLTHSAWVNASDKYGTTPLHVSVEKGNVPTTKILLNHGADVFCTKRGNSYYDKCTPLHRAADKGFEEICKLLLNNGASVNALSARQGTPLHIAIDKGHLNLVAMFLQNGADTNATKHDGETCLHIAARKGSVDVVQALLAKGFSVDVRNSRGVTPTFIAAQAGHENIVSLLLERGADVNIQDKNGKSILCNAVEKRSETFVDLVLKFSPDVNNEANRSTISTAALKYGNASGKIIESLLHYGFKAQLEVDNAKDVEVLRAAVEKGYFKLVEHMLKSCQNVDSLITATDSNGHTLLHVATEKRREDIVKLLISLGADVNALTCCSQSYTITKAITPLFYSVKNNDVNISKILLNNKAKPEGCLLTAVRNKNPELVELLLQHGADANSRDMTGRSSRSSLGLIVCDYIFAEDSSTRIAHLKNMLLKCGVDLKAERRAGESVLSAAIDTGDSKLVKIVLEYGGDVNEAADVKPDKKCSDLRTPLMVAVATGNADITTMLLEKGAAMTVALMPKKVTALHMAVCFEQKNVVDVLLKQPDVELDFKDCDDRTPLHYAAETGNAAIALALLRRGASVNCKDCFGKTPLHYASEMANGTVPAVSNDEGEDIAEALLRFGAEPNARDVKHGYNALHFWAANKKSQKRILSSLLEYGTDIDSKSSCGKTPFYVAVENGCEENVSLLMRYGADVNITHKIMKEGRWSYQSPLQCAEENHCKKKAEVTSPNVISRQAHEYARSGAEEYKRTCRREEEWHPDRYRSYEDYERCAEYEEDRLYHDAYERFESAFYDRYDEDHVITEFSQIADVIRRHMIMLDCANFYVNERDLQSIKYFDCYYDYRYSNDDDDDDDIDDNNDDDDNDDHDDHDDDDDRDSVSNDYCDDRNEVKQYRRECRNELSLLKRKKISGNPKISFHDFLTKSSNKLATLFEKENIAEIMSSAKFGRDLRSFVIYRDLINNLLNMALGRGNLLKSATQCFVKVFLLPDLCIDTITDYLRNVDLDNFVAACEQSDAKCFTDI